MTKYTSSSYLAGLILRKEMHLLLKDDFITQSETRKPIKSDSTNPSTVFLNFKLSFTEELIAMPIKCIFKLFKGNKIVLL